MNIQKALTKLLLKLPSPILVALSGGKPIIRDNRKLDARFQFIEVAAAKRPLPDPLTPEVARAGVDMLTDLFGGKVEAGVSWNDTTIPLSDRTVPARVYRPNKQRPTAPLLVFYHFGGGVVGNVTTCHAFCSMIAKQVECPVLSVEYRLAPEHQWPCGLDDAIDSFIWARDHASQFGATAGLAAVGGDSMGGNFAAILAQHLKANDLAQPILQVLIYPATDITSKSGSMQSCAQAYPLTQATMNWFMANYLPAGAVAGDVRISPAMSMDLTGLAPAIVVTAGHDPLRDQGNTYGILLSEANVPVTARCYDDLAHGFTAYTGAIPAADKASRDIAALIASAYQQQGY
jgi:acetyl esterase